MKLFHPHQEILSQAQQELWPQLRPAAGLGFVLTYFQGGDLQQLSSEVKATLIKAANAVRNLPQVELRARVLASVEEC